jgi:hypothetical protein
VRTPRARRCLISHNVLFSVGIVVRTHTHSHTHTYTTEGAGGRGVRDQIDRTKTERATQISRTQSIMKYATNLARQFRRMYGECILIGTAMYTCTTRHDSSHVPPEIFWSGSTKGSSTAVSVTLVCAIPSDESLLVSILSVAARCDRKLGAMWYPCDFFAGPWASSRHRTSQGCWCT